MSITIDCGEGKHAVCRGRGRYHYLIPQHDDGTEFVCACSCHVLATLRWVRTTLDWAVFSDVAGSNEIRDIRARIDETLSPHEGRT